MKLPVAEWLPDLGEYQNPGAITATNVLPGEMSYLPAPGLDVYSNALDARCQGTGYGKDDNGLSYIFAGDTAKLYLMSSATFADVSVAGGYTTALDGRWFFTQYASDVIATNFADPIQYFTLGTSSAFANLSADAPKAHVAARVLDFLIVGNTYDAIDGNVPYRIRWSALGDHTSWVVSATTQADYNDMDASKGWVMQIFGGEYGVVFQERAISVLTYIGSPQIFQIRQVETSRGLLTPDGAIQFGNYIAYMGQDGYYIFDGNQSIPIGIGKVNNYFKNDFYTGYKDRVSCAIDIDNQLIYWAYPGADNQGGNSNKLLVYNYSPSAKLRWSVINVNIELIIRTPTEGYTLEQLDNLSSDLDTLDAIISSIDSRALTGDNFLLAAFDASHQLNLFTGDSLTATIDTTEAQLFDNKRGFVSLMRHLVEGSSATVTVSVGVRDQLNESASFCAAVSANDYGEYEFRSNGRFHRARLTISGGFDFAKGIEVLSARPVGQR